MFLKSGLILGGILSLAINSCFAASDGGGLSALSSDPDPDEIIYAFTTGINPSDGGGDYIHGLRLLRLLEKLPVPKVFTRAIAQTYISYKERAEGNHSDGTILYDTSLELRPDLTPNLEILVSYARTLNRLPQIFISEYGRALLLDEWDIQVPLGLTYSLGYMKPHDIDLSETKASLVSRLSAKYRDQIYPDGNPENTLFVLGYISEIQKFPPQVLEALTRSPLAVGKQIVFLIKDGSRGPEFKKEVLAFKALFKYSTRINIILTKERIPDEDWKIMSQLAVASIASGDSSSSDPFFYRNLPLWNAHKTGEADAWRVIATQWKAPEGVYKEKILAYIDVLKSKDIDALLRFMIRIDAKFMEDWKQFAAYIEENYTLTPEKLDAVIDIGTQLHLAKTAGYIGEHYARALESLQRATRVLSFETIGALAYKFCRKSREMELENPFIIQLLNAVHKRANDLDIWKGKFFDMLPLPEEPA